MTSDVRPAREPKYYTVKRHLLDVIDALEPGAGVPTARRVRDGRRSTGGSSAGRG